MARGQDDCLLMCLIRCGETTWNAEDRVHGAVDLPLSAAGSAAVRNLPLNARTGRIGTVHHPDTEAAAATAKAFADKVKAKAKVATELLDANLGLLEGLEMQVFAERFRRAHRQWGQDPLRLAPPDGEPILEFRSRLFAAVARILKRARSEEVAIVLSPLGLGLLRCWLADRPTSELWAMLRDRPDVERYCLTKDQVKDLETEARAALVSA